MNDSRIAHQDGLTSGGDLLRQMSDAPVHEDEYVYSETTMEVIEHADDLDLLSTAKGGNVHEPEQNPRDGGC